MSLNEYPTSYDFTTVNELRFRAKYTYWGQTTESLESESTGDQCRGVAEGTCTNYKYHRFYFKYVPDCDLGFQSLGRVWYDTDYVFQPFTNNCGVTSPCRNILYAGDIV